MKLRYLLTGLCLGLTPMATGHALAYSNQTTPRYVTIDGEVIRYEPGHVIVIRKADNKEALYTLAPAATLPDDIRVGRHVTLYTEPGEDGGTQIVTRVTTTTVTPEGNIKRTTEDTRTSP